MWVAAGKIDDMKSEKNKTIDLTVEEGKAYLDRCLRYEEGNEYKEEQISDKILIGDSLKVAGTLPAGFVDLMIEFSCLPCWIRIRSSAVCRVQAPLKVYTSVQILRFS